MAGLFLFSPHMRCQTWPPHDRSHASIFPATSSSDKSRHQHFLFLLLRAGCQACPYGPWASEGNLLTLKTVKKKRKEEEKKKEGRKKEKKWHRAKVCELTYDLMDRAKHHLHVAPMACGSDRPLNRHWYEMGNISGNLRACPDASTVWTLTPLSQGAWEQTSFLWVHCRESLPSGSLEESPSNGRRALVTYQSFIRILELGSR